MENVRKRVDVKLLRSDEEEKILKYVAKADLSPAKRSFMSHSWLVFKIGKERVSY